MEKGYSFKSTLFEITKGEDEETNPGCYGKALAEWLCSKFMELGYDTEVIPEDWGWCVMCYFGEYLLWLGCGVMPDEELLENYDVNSPPNGSEVIWHVFPHIEVPLYMLKSKIRVRLGKLDIKAPIQKLKLELDQILTAEKEIHLCEEP